MTGLYRHWDMAGLERKVRAAGRPWTVGDLAMVHDGQWGADAQPGRWPEEETVVEHRIEDGRCVEMTVEALARAVRRHHDEGLA